LGRKLEELHAFSTFKGKFVSRVFQFVDAEKEILVKLFIADVTKILFHLVYFFHVFPQTVLVGKNVLALVTLHLNISRLQPLMIDLFVPLKMGVPCEVFITEVTLEGSLARVPKHVGL